VDIAQIRQKLKESLSNKGFVKNLLLSLAALAIILLLGAIVVKEFSQERYAVLYANLSPEDAGKILTVLQEERIPYKVEGQGSIILVPRDKVYDIRLKLAAKGLPSSEGVGFEIFDEPKMGATHFQENINYIRAIEGELARTIKRIDAIKDAKVNIAMPRDSIFAREEDEPKASVIISLWPGRDLTKEQVKAIVFLVSHAVPKLKPENVTVVDNRGRVLSDMIEEDDEELKDIVDIKRKLKREIEKSVQSMLARALGPQKVVVRANVDVETARVAKEDQIVDPEKVAVVSERKIQEKERGFEKKPLGAPGTPTNVPATIDNTGERNLLKDRSKKDTTTNYDVTKSLIRTEQNLFRIKRITVGVLIDGRYVTKEENGTTRKVFEPRSEAEIKAYEQLIKSAVGFDEKRGDKVTVVSVPFETGSQQVEEGFAGSLRQSWERYGLYGAVGVLSLALVGLVLFMAMKMRRLREEQLQQLEALRAATTAQGLEAAQQAAQKVYEKELEEFHIEQEPAYKKILEIVDENPDVVADMISKWMKEEK